MILKERKETGVIIDTTKGEQTVTLVAGIDAGSTETRVSLVNQSDFEELLNPTSAEKTLEVIDSMYVIPCSRKAIYSEAPHYSRSKNKRCCWFCGKIFR